MLLVTADEMRRLDRATIDGGHVAGAELMERAGRGVAAAMERHYGPLLGLRVLVLCGPGNNGGDGFVAARHLEQRGAEVAVAILADPDRITGDARDHLERLAGTRVTVAVARDPAGILSAVSARDAWDFALDALLGTGARGVPEGAIADGVQALRELDEAGTRVIAVDLPTGVDADTGAIARRAVRADLTVTFGAPKRGHVLYPGRAFAGALEVVDIGLVAPAAAQLAVPVELATEAAMVALVPHRDPRAHKGTSGRVVIVGGAPGLTGAVALAARGATRAGAGYVQAMVGARVGAILAIKLTEEMTIACADGASGALALDALEPILALASHADVLVVGCGLSLDPQAAELARRLVAEAPCPVVLDADGLNAFEGCASTLAHAGMPRVLTPHIGEMGRLTGMTAEALEASRIDVARRFAVEWNAVVVLKGAPTVTASPDGAATVNATGNPAMATAGMGDVLTGAIAALIAQGLDSYAAARLAVYLHGLAGDLEAHARGPLGLAALDVAERLPFAIHTLTRLRDRGPEPGRLSPKTRTPPGERGRSA